MRKRWILTAILAAALSLFAAPRRAEAEWSVSISFFHQQLSPYGRWVVAGSYGHCWVPAGVATGWAPYVDGEWIWTDYGWTWASHDPWGDIPFHYGTWVWVDPYGWVWEPGTIWAPAWVTWAYTDDYIGWAPVPPSFFLSARGYLGPPVVVSHSFYCFVPARQFVGFDVSAVRVPVQQNSQIFTRAVTTTNYSVSGGVVHVAGPSPSRIERATGRHIAPVSVERARTRPMPLSAAHAVKTGHVQVVASSGERARAIPASSGPTAGRQPEAAKQQRAAAEKPKPAKHERAATSTAEVRHAKPQTEAAPRKPPPKTHAQAAPAPSTSAQKRSPEKISREHERVASHSPHPAPVPGKAQAKPAQRPPSQPQRHEETRVAGKTSQPAIAAMEPKHERARPEAVRPPPPQQPATRQVQKHPPAPEKKKEKEGA